MTDSQNNISTGLEAPPTLKASNHWVLRNGKRPVNKAERSEGWADPDTWMSFDEALRSMKSPADKYRGLGYIIQRDPKLGDLQIIGGNLDNCRDPNTGWVSPWAESFLKSINGCTSISISGCGFRFFCLGKLPGDINKVTGHGPDDLSSEAMINIQLRKPDIKNGILLGQPIWNKFEIYESGLKHLTITGDWLPGYPDDLPDRRSEILEVIRPFLGLEPEVTESPISNERQDEPLPFLSILQVIDTSSFREEGDELVGPHPLLGSSTGANLRVKMSENAWHYVHAGNEVCGDSWMWLACECGAVAWEDCKSGALIDSTIIPGLKRYAVEKGYIKKDELLDEEHSLEDAYRFISELKEKVLTDPGIAFDPRYVNSLVVLKLQDQPEFERTKHYLKGKVSWRELSKLINDKINLIAHAERALLHSAALYIEWENERPILSVGLLLEDILHDMHACVIAGTEKDLAIYNEKTGTYVLGKSGMRSILTEAISRIKNDGDLELKCLTPSNISKIKALAPVLALEIDDNFESMGSVICVGNGVVDLRTSRMIEWSPDWFMVNQTSVHYMPDKDWKELAPTFHQAMMRTFDGDSERIEYFQRYMGYCATGETIEDSILVLIGVGGVGKSTLLDCVREALGDGYSRVIKADLEKKSGAGTVRDGIARARYARLMILKELEKNNNLSWGTLKELSSNSSVIEARKLYGHTENLRLKSKLVIDTNFLPRADEPDRSILRRIKPLPFRHIMTEEEKDPRIYDHIVKNELAGVLSWIVEGARKWYESGLGSPAFIEEELSIYQASMDTHLAVSWLEQSGYRISHNVAQLTAENWVRTTELYADYRSYAESGGAKVYSIQDFSAFLEARGARKDQKIRTIDGKSERSVFWLNIEKAPISC